MKIFINLPTWLGDCVMSSVALKAIFDEFVDAKFVLYGSFASCELFKSLPNCDIIVSEKKRYTQILKLRNKLETFDLALSFRSAFSSKIILNLIKAKKRFYFDKNENKGMHQVLKYVYFVEKKLNLKVKNLNLWLPIKPIKTNEKILGINPGAKYGSAKRWNSEYFATLATYFKDYKILIFGIKSELELCNDIENLLKKENKNVLNLCGKTSIKELCEHISSLDFFITNDSGPMHIATVYKIKTLVLFGPTNFKQTSPFNNENAKIIHLNLPCMPCMKRTCPLKHHKCMQDLTPDIALNVVNKYFKL
ncbi:glycosyltransferase family 9 protein [Campylobacter sp. LR264d]|uniref:glycosyltransferase family 9 protein n=1 Tax=Campylobacter sp. LR264d TaxID=2593544 RepID=UPI00123A094D|nr:glycosyltransferase family 9 protein [Campylobacter sp. LR264d]KAA6233784.1 glycosyltransferase family 9 protein [Campylobacter sp. LR264d]